MVPKEQVQAVCEGILPSFPDAASNPPRVPEHYFDSGPDVAIIRSEKYSLRISEECFAGEAWMIVGSLVSLGYALLLTEHKRLLLACVPGRARSGLPCVATVGDWYLLIWSNEDLTAG
jgi:hypothetical protein